MKAQILKLAGVKTEAEFYKKYPTEEAFMKKHGKALKKAQDGVKQPLAFNDLREDALTTLTGVSKEDRQRQQDLANKEAEIEAIQNQKKSSGGFGDMFSNIDPETIESFASSFGGAKNGKKIKKASNGLGMDTPDTSKKDTAMQIAATFSPMLAPIVEGMQELKQEKIDIGNAQAWAKISGITRDASGSREEQAQRKYVRPEDQMMPTQNAMGTGTNYLAQNGARVSGNLTEIQNMYNPGDMYNDLGYEPLNDSNPKQYKKGGKVMKAQNGFGNFMGKVGTMADKNSGGIGQTAGSWGSKLGGGSGKVGPRGKMAGSFGKQAGKAATLITGIPGLESLGEATGNFVGSIFDGKQQKKIKTANDITDLNVDVAALQTGVKDTQQQYGAAVRNGGYIQSYEDGGYVSHNWNPQVITKFGDLDVSDVHTFAADGMPEYRAGGHLQSYTPPSEEAMYTGRDLPYQMEDGGEVRQSALNGAVRTTWGGGIKTLSHNPYLPGTGETIQFVGNSHDTYDPKSGNTGIGVKYGEGQNPQMDYAKFGTREADANVEVEKEPAIETIDPQTGEKKLEVGGDMYIPNYGVEEIGDPKAKGKKFKHYITDLSKQEAKQNTIIEKSTALANNADVNDPFDRLSLASANAMQIGADMKLEDIAKNKLNAFNVQNAILDTAKKFGIKSAELAKGKIVKVKPNDRYAEFGAQLDSFKPGGKKAKKPTLITDPSKDVNTLQSFVNNIPFAERKAMASNMGVKNFKGTAEQNDFLLKKTLQSDYAPLEVRDSLKTKFATPKSVMDASVKNNFAAPSTSTSAQGPDWTNLTMASLLSQLSRFRPMYNDPLDASQIAPEMLAMSMNQPQAVQAQSFTPLLTQPYRISLQDQRNEVTAASRAAEKMAAYNPAAASMIFAQAAEAKNKINAEEFRANQAEQARSMEQNRAILNDAQGKNLAIFDQQYVRQSQADSNTRQQAIEISKALAEKDNQNKLQNKTLNVYSNLFPGFTFTPEGQVYKNASQTALFNPGTVGGIRGEGDTDQEVSKEAIAAAKALAKLSASGKAKNGAIVKAIKNL